MDLLKNYNINDIINFMKEKESAIFNDFYYYATNYLNDTQKRIILVQLFNDYGYTSDMLDA